MIDIDKFVAFIIFKLIAIHYYTMVVEDENRRKPGQSVRCGSESPQGKCAHAHSAHVRERLRT